MPRHTLHVVLSSALALGLVCGCGSSQRRSDYSEGSYLVPPQPAPAPAETGDVEAPMVRNGYDGEGLPRYPDDTRPAWEYEANPFQPANPPGLNVNPFEAPPTDTGDPDVWTPPPVEAPRPPAGADVAPELVLKDLGATVERDAMGRVVIVDLSGTRVADDDLAVLGELPDVRQLDVSSTGITDSGLKYVANLPELQLLALSGTGVGDAGIAQLKSLRLRFLLLGFTSVSDTSVETLARMEQLEGLSLRGTKITGDGLARLKRSLPKCKIVADPQTSSTGPARPGTAAPPAGPTYPVDSTPPRRNDTPAMRDRSTQNISPPGLPVGTALRPGNRILSDAEQQLIQIAVGNLADPRTLDAVGEYYAAMGRLDDALPWLTAAVEIAPEQRTCRYHLGLVLARLGRSAEALGHFEAAVGSPAAHYNLGVVSYQRDDLAASRQEFREALRQDPDLEPAREWLDRVERDIAARNGETRHAMSR